MDFPATNNVTASQKLEPLLRAAMDASPGELAQSPNLSAGILDSGSLWEIIVLYTGTPDNLRQTFPNLSITFLANNYAIIQLPENQIPTLASSSLITYIEKPKQLFFEVLAGKRASCISPLQPQTPDSALRSLSGQNTIVAIIDSGIDYSHPDFRNPDGTTRILELWDQTIPADAARGFYPPEGYALGSVFTKEQIDAALNAPSDAQREALCPSRDLSGHGTHVAGIAAGNGRASEGVYKGVAYQAKLIIVKLQTASATGFPSTTQLMQAVDFCVKKSIAYNLPAAINLSFGNTYGSHSGTSLLETYLDSVANLGRISIIVGSGNEGNSAGHAAGRMRENESRRIEFAVGDYEQSLSIQIWKNYWDEIRISLLPPSGSAPLVIPDMPGSWRFQTDGTQILVYYGEPSPYSRYQEIYIELLGGAFSSGFGGGYIADGVWSIQLSAQSITDGIYDMWMPASALRGIATQFLSPSPETTLTIPSTASKVITVGAYDAFSNTLAPFSGRGFTFHTNQVKPDLVAPGVDITSASPGGGYEARTGTSMATPFVTGSCALLMQWGIVNENDPFLYGEKLKAYLIRGAKRLAFADTYPNPQTGWGALCAADAIPL